ncbi:MAG: LysR family transcriptional regulator [Gemmatimonadaceae bacterium]|nr:LysR family transcriptional regulator [Gemmatimonadaceae bacterium]
MNTDVELRHLRGFLAVADELHFGRAAERLQVAQPALSQQIRRLEAQLGTPLFRRSTRRVELTDAGAHLREEARRILAEVDAALDAARRVGRGDAGTLRVGFAASVMFLALPRLIRRFRSAFPGVHLELRELPTGTQITALRNGELEVGFLRQLSAVEGLRMERVMRERLLMALPRTHDLARRPRLSLADLAAEDFVLFPRELAPGLYTQVVELCLDAGFAPRVVQESRELYTTVSLVEAGVGVSIIPASVRKMGWTGVVYRQIHKRQAETNVSVAWRAGNDRAVVHSFLQVARTLVRG